MSDGKQKKTNPRQKIFCFFSIFIREEKRDRSKEKGCGPKKKVCFFFPREIFFEKGENWPQAEILFILGSHPSLIYTYISDFVLKSRVCSLSVHALSTLIPIDIRRADKSNSRY